MTAAELRELARGRLRGSAMTVSEQVAPVVRTLRTNSMVGVDTILNADAADAMARGLLMLALTVDELRARLRLIGLAVLLLAFGGLGVILRSINGG